MLMLQDVLDKALENNPEMIGFDVQFLEARQCCCQAKAEKGLNANMNLSYGLKGQDSDIPGAYQRSTTSRG